MKKLNYFRDHLDQIDSQIVSLLDERMKLSDDIAKYKMQMNLPILDMIREGAVLTHTKSDAMHFVLKEMIETIYESVMACSRTSQRMNQGMSIPFKRVGIIGLGLIGGSMAKAIKAKNANVSIHTLAFDSPDLVEAKRCGVVDTIHQTIDDLCGHVDLIVLATPPHAILPMAIEIVKSTKIPGHRLLVCDVAGVKEKIAAEFERLSDDSVEFIATHPMAGCEKSGFWGSSGVLFANAPWLITPHRKNTESNLHKLAELITFLGGCPKRMEAQAHDQKAALVSHILGVISESLLTFIEETDRGSLDMAGPGFKSMTRLAKDNPLLRKEILMENHQNVVNYLEDWVGFLQERIGNL